MYQITNDEGVGLTPGGVIAYLAPQYYINNNISVGLQYEFDILLLSLDEYLRDDDMTFMVTGDYYFGNGVIRPSLGLGVGVNSSETLFGKENRLCSFRRALSFIWIHLFFISAMISIPVRKFSR